jgi:hypothetical protein
LWRGRRGFAFGVGFEDTKELGEGGDGEGACCFCVTDLRDMAAVEKADFTKAGVCGTGGGGYEGPIEVRAVLENVTMSANDCIAAVLG